MKTHTITTYNIDEHPDQEKVFDWIRNNWHDLGDFSLQEAVESLKGFADFFNLKIDYSISIVPDRCEFIRFNFNNDDIEALQGIRLWKYINNNFDISKDYPFTGVCYDETLLDEIRAFLKKPDSRDFEDLISDCCYRFFKVIHDEGGYIYSDEGLKELCQSNEYYFLESGECYQ